MAENVSSAAGQQAVEAPVAAQVLIAGNEANLAEIRTTSGNATILFERDEYADALDRDGKSFRSKTAQVEFRRDQQKLRIDRTFDRTFDLANKEVIYHFPLVDHVVEKDDVKSVTRANGTTRETVRHLSVGDRQYNYFPESKLLYILPPEDRFLAPLELSWLSRGPDIHGRTLRQMVAEAVRRGMTIEVRDDEAGRHVLSMSIRTTLPDNRTADMGLQVVVDPNKGYTVQRVEGLQKPPGGITDYNYAHVGGAWVLLSADERLFDPSGKVVSRVVLTVDQSSLKVNQPIDQAAFEVDDLHIAKGSGVLDKLKGEKYRYNDIPARLKFELNRAAQPRVVGRRGPGV